MIKKGKHKCYHCESEFEWSIKIKDNSIDDGTSKMNEERGIPTFTAKGKVEIDVNCPSCRNVNRFKQSLK